MNIEINELDNDGIKEGSLQSLSNIYPSGIELQIEIIEND